MPPSPTARLLPAPRETAPSFLSRCVAALRLDPATYAYEIGVSFKRIIAAEDVAIRSLVETVGLTGDWMDKLISWTGVATGEVRMSYRGESFVSRALRSPDVRGCPVCLQEDADIHDRPAAESMAYRGDWQLR